MFAVLFCLLFFIFCDKSAVPLVAFFLKDELYRLVDVAN